MLLPVTRGDQWEEISFEEVGGVENVPRAIVENALRAYLEVLEDAARRKRDIIVRLARKRSIRARRRFLQGKFQKYFRKAGAEGLLYVRRYIKRFVPDEEEIRARFPSRHGFAFDFYCTHYGAALCQNALHWYYD